MSGCILFGESFFCSGLMKYQHFLICWWIRAPILSQCMLLVRFSESRMFCIGLVKYQQFWFFDRFVCCIGRPFDHYSWALRNHSQIENVKTAQCFSYVFDTISNHIEWMLPTTNKSWACWTHRQIENVKITQGFSYYFQITLDGFCLHFRIPEHLEIINTLTNVNISLDQCKKSIL